MFTTQKDAEAFAQRYLEFFDESWTMEEKWTLERFAAVKTDDCQTGVQGQWTKNAIESMELWKPLQNLYKTHKTLGFDIKAFAPNMVSLDYYAVGTTFEDKELFGVSNLTLDVNEEGKVVREMWTMAPKYGQVFEENIQAFIQTLNAAM